MTDTLLQFQIFCTSTFKYYYLFIIILCSDWWSFRGQGISCFNTRAHLVISLTWSVFWAIITDARLSRVTIDSLSSNIWTGGKNRWKLREDFCAEILQLWWTF